MTYQEAMTRGEYRAIGSLAAIYATRMLGLFMILPVFSVYAAGMPGASPSMIGLAIGIYGITQGLLQIPFGRLSDRFGRKPLITLGLVLFIIGSVVAANGESIQTIIIGRALQGAGAVAAVVMALVADLTREEHRIKAMAMIGMSIGASFMLAMVLGPLLGSWVGLSGIFWFTAILASLAIVILYVWVPTPVHSTLHRDAQAVPAEMGVILRDRQLLRLNFGIMTLHMVLTAIFVVIPLIMMRDMGLDSVHHWKVYLGVMLAAIVTMVPFIILAEKKRKIKPVFAGAIALLAVAMLALGFWADSLPRLIVVLWLFFTGFNLLEATLPSLIAKTAPPQSKGTAMGVYTSFQFIGVYLGGHLGGYLYGAYGVNGVVALAVSMLAIWVALALTMKQPQYVNSFLLRVGKLDAEAAAALNQKLLGVTGVVESMIVLEEGVAYLKVDKKQLDEQSLYRYSVN